MPPTNIPTSIPADPTMTWILAVVVISLLALIGWVVKTVFADVRPAIDGLTAATTANTQATRELRTAIEGKQSCRLDDRQPALLEEAARVTINRKPSPG